ncbi:unnamed protein product, partial [Pelagomonas calceolata]
AATLTRERPRRPARARASARAGAPRRLRALRGRRARRPTRDSARRRLDSRDPCLTFAPSADTLSKMAKLALALLAAPAVAFVAPGQQAASKVVVKGDIGVDPGPIDPSGPFWEDQEGLARRRAVEIKHGRISMMAFLGMMVQELGITFPGSINLDGSVQFSDILKDGMGFPAVANIPTFGLFQIVAFAGFAEIGAMPAAQYTGGPQNLPGGYDGSVGTISGGYPFTTQIEDVTARNRALTCELQNGRAAMLGTFGAMCHSCVDSCDHHFFYPITHN